MKADVVHGDCLDVLRTLAPGIAPPRPLRRYDSVLTAQINRKGVLDVDSVKGCSAGVAAYGLAGCYGACYAAAMAARRGIDFSCHVTRCTNGYGHARAIESAVRAAPQGFFRVGTMGDPSLDWAATVGLVEWLAPYSTPVIVTKHWLRATDDQLRRLVAAGAVLNTSVSALDAPAELAHRERERTRFACWGGHSVLRVVTCDFTAAASDRARVQCRLLSQTPVIDNPLRLARAHALVHAGVVALSVRRDLTRARTVSLGASDAYLGRCDGCPDLCGLTSRSGIAWRPSALQGDLFDREHHGH